MRPLFLIGFMACGKSTLLQALAARVPGRTYIDLDSETERLAGKSIPAIFAEDGEERFRQLESEVLASLCDSDAIVACGGGTPCRPGAMDAMLEAGTVVWLKADTDITVQRLALAPGQRPVIDNLIDNPEALRSKVESLMAEREPYYSRATAVFDSSRLDDEHQIEESARLFIDTFLTTTQSDTNS